MKTAPDGGGDRQTASESGRRVRRTVLGTSGGGLRPETMDRSRRPLTVAPRHRKFLLHNFPLCNFRLHNFLHSGPRPPHRFPLA